MPVRVGTVVTLGSIILAACASQAPAPTTAVPAPAKKKIKMPPLAYFPVGPEAVGYPIDAANRNEHGAVDIEFAVNADGRTTGLKEIYEASPALGAAAAADLRGAKFKVPSDWEASGGPSQRFTIEWQYSIPCPDPSTPAAKRAQPTRIPGVPTLMWCKTLPAAAGAGH
jgi:TonB family protein